MSPAPFLLRSTAITDIGRVRRQNEDRFLRRDDLSAYGVADGIGGLPGGAQAAQAAIQALETALTDNRALDRAQGLVAVLQEINQHVHALGLRLSPDYGIGTTLTCGLIRADRLWLAHIGDSRCYLLRDGQIQPLTEDHSLENDLRRGSATVADLPANFVLSERNRQALSRCIGQPDRPEIDVCEVPLAVGDRLLFVTDGVFRVVPPGELADILQLADEPSARLTAIVVAANQRGGPDNATAVLIELLPPPSDSTP